MNNSDLNISIVDSLPALHELREDWERLENHFCLSWQWLIAWWEKIGQNSTSNRLCVIQMNDGEQVVGIAPLFIEHSTVLGRTLKFLGSGDACSDYMSFPTQPGYETAMANAVFTLINHNDFCRQMGGVDLIELEGHLATDPTINAFTDLAKKAKFEITSREIEGCWKVEIPSDWEQFRKVVKKSQRRKINKVDRIVDTENFQINYLTEAAELKDAWPAFVELHQKRRQQLGQSGCFANSEFNQFLCDATLRLANADRVLMTMVSHDEKPFGAILCFVSGDCICVYQSGLDTDKQQFEPGHFANTMTFRAVQEQGFATVDFLRGDERYKSDWGCERTPLYRTRLIAPKLTSQLRHRILVGGRSVRNWTHDLWNRSLANFSRSAEGV